MAISYTSVLNQLESVYSNPIKLRNLLDTYDDYRLAAYLKTYKYPDTKLSVHEIANEISNIRNKTYA